MKIDRSTNKKWFQILMEEHIANGRPVEAAWLGYCYCNAPQDVDIEQLEDMRRVFFAGATFLFTTVTDSARQSRGMPTQEQLEYMSQLSRELRAYVDEMLPTEGNA